jgi:HK97 family phage major capsid protein
MSEETKKPGSAELTADQQLAYKPQKLFKSVAEVCQEQEEAKAQAMSIYERAELENRPLQDAETAEAGRLMDYHRLLEVQEKPQAAKLEQMTKDALTAMPIDRLPKTPAQLETFREPKAPQPNVISQKLQAFTPEIFGTKAEAHRAAEETGHFLRATLAGNQESIRFCQSRSHLAPLVGGSHQMVASVNHVAVDALGGYLVPEATARTVLDVRDRAGVAAALANNYTMIEETDLVPKRIAGDDADAGTGVIVYKPDELSQIGVSNKNWGQVSLAATDAFTLCLVSHKLMRGAVVDAADQIINEIGYQFARQQDNEFINGDGVAGAPFWGIDGLVDTQAGGVTVSTGATSYETITADHLNTLIGLLPDRFHTRSAGVGGSGAAMQPAFLCSHAFWAASIARIQAAAGGNTIGTLSADVPFSYLGYPIVFSEFMPSAYALSQNMLYFGNFSDSVLLGMRENVSISLSEHLKFDYDQLAIKGRISYDMKYHENGDATNAGGVVVLQSVAV